MGVAGELYIGGDGLAARLPGPPGADGRAFVPDPFGAPGARLYRTGDWVRGLPDGSIEYLGRLDHQVKLRGFRIELGEIEAALRRSRRCGKPSAWSRGCQMVRQSVCWWLMSCWLQPNRTRRIGSGLWMSKRAPCVRRCRRRCLPTWCRSVVVLEYLPLTPNGKVDRRALPAPDVSAVAATYEAPRTRYRTGRGRHLGRGAQA